MNLNRLRKLRKTLGAGTLFIFLLSNSVYGMVPSVEVVPSRETPAFLRIDVPSDLARVEDIYEAPPKVDPSLIVHIQNAHGNYEAQLKIRKLMQYLYQTYGFKLFFVEGAVEKLNPDYLKLLDDTDHNREVAEALAREGKLTGAEFYLVDAPEDVAAVGIEQPDLYRANYEAFQEVYGFENDTREFLEKIDQRLSQIASRVFSPDLRRMVQEWRKFESGQREFMPYVKSLSQEARKTLGVDLESLYAQAEWPHLSRLLILQSMEKDLDLEKGKTEKAAVILELRKLGVSQEVVQAIEGLEEKKITMNSLEPGDERLENLPRYLIERLIEEASPKGFRLSDYPDFGLYAGYFILKSEVDSKMLFEEIEKLFEKILDRLAAEEKDKKLLMLFRDQELLRKFFSLEISREQWDKFAERQSVLAPEAFEMRIQKQEAGPSIRVSKSVLQAFQTGVKFYHLARQRDLVFFYRIKQAMLKQKESKSTLLTGGFHTEGVFDRFRKEDVNYGVLMPRIGGEINRDIYVDTMLDTHPSMFKAATVEQPPLAASFSELASLGVEDVTRAVKWPLQAAIERNLKQWVPRGTDPSKDYYSAERFSQAYNASPMAHLRQSALVFASPAQTSAYLFVAGQPLRNDAGQYLTLDTTEVENAEGVPVRVFGTHSSFIDQSPESAGIQIPRFDLAVPAEEAQETTIELPPGLETEAAQFTPRAETANLVLAASRVEALRNLIMISPDVQQTLNEPGNLRRFFDLYSALDLQAEFERADDIARASLAGRAASLVAFGFAPLEDEGDDLAGYFGFVHSLARDSQPESAKSLEALKAQAGIFSSDLPGTLVTVSEGVPTTEEALGVEAQIAVNPKLHLYFAVTVSESADLAGFRSELRDIEAGILNSLRQQGVESPENRVSFEAVASTPQAVRRAIEAFFNKRIKPGLSQKSPVDHRSPENAFAVLATNDTASSFNLGGIIDTMSATLIYSEPLSLDLRNTERFAAATLAQRLNASDKSGVQAVKLRESTSRGINEREWRIDKSELTVLQKAILALTEAFQGLKRLAASA